MEYSLKHLREVRAKLAKEILELDAAIVLVERYDSPVCQVNVKPDVFEWLQPN